MAVRRRGFEHELAEQRAWLSDPDAQVRLNAAVRLAYLDCADGLAELIAGLEHPRARSGWCKCRRPLPCWVIVAWLRCASWYDTPAPRGSRRLVPSPVPASSTVSLLPLPHRSATRM